MPNYGCHRLVTQQPKSGGGSDDDPKHWANEDREKVNARQYNEIKYTFDSNESLLVEYLVIVTDDSEE